ncbi:hypothetical protein RVR34_02100 [Microcystis aeruginosa FBCC-A68]|nr:hypothetical protein [Microcystis aeruginosa]
MGCGVWGVGCGVWGETIHNLRVNHTIKKGFGIRFIQQTLQPFS